MREINKSFMKTSVVAIEKIEKINYDKINVEQMVRKAIDNLGGISKFVRPGQSVFIKPNVAFPNSAVNGVTVEPKIVGELIELSKEAGASKIWVGESSANGIDTKEAFKKVGISEIIQRAGGEEIYLDDVPLVSVSIPNGKALRSIKIPKLLVDANVIVNVAKAKTHYIDAITCCVKNWVGIIPQKYRLSFHQNRLSQVVAELIKKIPPKLNLVDALIVGEGEGPTFVDPRFMGVIIAGNDPVATDAVVGNLMGFNVNELEFAWAAFMEGVGEIDLNRIRILGPPLDEIRIHVRRPLPVIYNRFPCNIILGGACPGCLTWFVGTIAGRLKEKWDKILTATGKPTFMIGYNAEDPYFEEHLKEGKYFVIGDCSPERYKRNKQVIFISGCCPGPQIPSTILKELGG